eukprot:gene55517-25153_t
MEALRAACRGCVRCDAFVRFVSRTDDSAADLQMKRMILAAPGILVGVLLLDLWAAAYMLQRAWSVAVLWMDVMLVMQTRAAVQRFILASVMLYLALERAEHVTRFGLYDTVVGSNDIAEAK